MTANKLKILCLIS